MTGPPLRVPAEDHRALCTHDLTGLHPWGRTRAMVRGTLDPADPPTRGDVLIAMGPRAPGHDRVWEPGARARATRQPTSPTPSRSRR
ncbi:hypothetical protein AB0G15_32845 [Streptosporangium sp. NPDC023825]|uniref:hypothetical protein n=1 Tax=Streptosporangium sp. NPDC023825 TaxID=3154909 RepID=UPI0034299FE4